MISPKYNISFNHQSTPKKFPCHLLKLFKKNSHFGKWLSLPNHENDCIMPPTWKSFQVSKTILDVNSS